MKSSVNLTSAGQRCGFQRPGENRKHESVQNMSINMFIQKNEWKTSGIKSPNKTKLQYLDFQRVGGSQPQDFLFLRLKV